MQADTVSSDRECPHCQYDMSGTTLAWEGREIDSGRCPECGEVVLLEEFAGLDRSPPPWLFEAYVRHPVVSFLLTCAHLAAPWRFWRLVRLEHRTDRWRLLFFAAFFATVAAAAGGFSIASAFHDAEAAGLLAWGIGAWTAPGWSAWLLSPYTPESWLRRRSGSLRPVCYSFIFPGIILPAALVAGAALGPGADRLELFGGALLGCVALGAGYWWFVIHRYLRVTFPFRFCLFVGIFTPMLAFAWSVACMLMVALTFA